MTERCLTCRFWGECDADDDGNRMGYCHRYPPVLPQTDAQESWSERSFGSADGKWMGFHPITFQEDFCGEWQPRADEDDSHGQGTPN
jgi:hypothetical protein